MHRLLLLPLMFCGIASGAFVAPNDGAAPFRRDKLPIDVETMTTLSKQLVVLAATQNSGDPQTNRAAAQMLALALALDPSNRHARDTLQSLSDGNPVRVPDTGIVDQSRNRAWNLLDWLEQPEAGKDGQALGACLGDVLVRVDPDHPTAEGRHAEGERGEWNGWVAPLDSFREDDSPKEDPVEGQQPETPEVKTGKAELRMKTVTLQMPLWYYDLEEEINALDFIEVTLATWIDEEGSGPRFRISGEEREDWNLEFGNALVPFLESRHGRLPKGLVFDITVPEKKRVSSRNGDLFATGIAILTDAAFSGRVPMARVLAVTDGEGLLELPVHFWQVLRELDSKEGCRLILPAAAAEYLPALLTMDRSEFFIRNEILLAKDLTTLLDFVSREPAERVVKAGEAFEKVRAARGTRSLGGFLSFESTRSHLTGITQILPEHASAEMLLRSSTLKWPRQLPRPIYAREIRAVLEPIGAVLDQRFVGLEASEVQELEAMCREGLAKVEKVHESAADRTELCGPAILLVKRLGALASDVKRLEEDESIEWKIRPVYREYIRIMKLLTHAAGDEDDYPLPTFDRDE